MRFEFLLFLNENIHITTKYTLHTATTIKNVEMQCQNQNSEFKTIQGVANRELLFVVQRVCVGEL